MHIHLQYSTKFDVKHGGSPKKAAGFYMENNRKMGSFLSLVGLERPAMMIPFSPFASNKSSHHLHFLLLVAQLVVLLCVFASVWNQPAVYRRKQDSVPNHKPNQNQTKCFHYR